MARVNQHEGIPSQVELIRSTNVEDAIYVANNLQPDDQKEVEGLGLIPATALLLSVHNSEIAVSFFNPKGDLCGIAGVSRTDAHCGAIWMLTTPHIRPYPKLFLKEAKQWVDNITSFDVLHNIADPRNYLHMKLLHKLGFKKLMYRTVGPACLTYVEFAKLTKCALNPLPLQP